MPCSPTLNVTLNVSGFSSVHFAYKVIAFVTAVSKSYAFVNLSSSNQPSNLKPSAVGFSGLVTLPSFATFCSAGAVPCSPTLNVTLNVVGSVGAGSVSSANTFIGITATSITNTISIAKIFLNFFILLPP